MSSHPEDYRKQISFTDQSELVGRIRGFWLNKTIITYPVLKFWI